MCIVFHHLWRRDKKTIWVKLTSDRRTNTYTTGVGHIRDRRPWRDVHQQSTISSTYRVIFLLVPPKMLETAKSVPKKWKYGNVTETFTFLVEIWPSPTLRTFWAEPVQKVTLYLPACPHLYLHHLDQYGIYDMINISFKTPSIINIHALTSTTLIKMARQLLLSAQLNLCRRAIHDMTICFASEKHFLAFRNTDQTSLLWRNKIA